MYRMSYDATSSVVTETNGVTLGSSIHMDYVLTDEYQNLDSAYLNSQYAETGFNFPMEQNRLVPGRTPAPAGKIPIVFYIHMVHIKLDDAAV